MYNVLAYTFPSSLTSEERKYLHLKSAELGLKSKSHGLVKQLCKFFSYI